MERIIYQLFVVLLFACYINSRPNGSPKNSCFYMTPRHIHPHTYRKVFPTKAMGLYNITTSADVFRPDRPIRVTLWGPPFKGFMMVAAEEGSKDWPTGIFYSDHGVANRMDCLSRGDTVTHLNNSYKDSVSVLWYGPESMNSEQIQFVPRGSVTQAPTNWWNRGGTGNSWGSGANNVLNGWGANAAGTNGGFGGGGSGGWNQGSGTGTGQQASSWGAAGGGGDWQYRGQGSLTSSHMANPQPTQRNPNGGSLQWADVNNGAGWTAGQDSWGGTPMEGPNPNGQPVWHWSSGQITSPKPKGAQAVGAEQATGTGTGTGTGSQWSVSALMELIGRLSGAAGTGGQTPAV
ncbi:FRRS1-like protein [Mya arenaria]|uniref:FRRS1-like protein n=1 Tax=Mya arenaria TaxID=6604 RepID=A0ABY7EVD4_MYAAR|nr:FRRS1-like protein [Mya arenaria]